MQRSDQSGFTLIEVLISSVAIALVIAAVMTAFTNVEAVNRRSRNLTIATQLAVQQLESYRNTTFNSLIPGSSSIDLSGYPSLGAPKTGTAVISQLNAAGLDQVDVTIAWTESGAPKTVHLTTEIAERGIDK